MALIYAYLAVVLSVWVRRAILMLGSIKRYTLIPVSSGWADGPCEKISLIIPCRNESYNLATLVPSLLNQDYPNLEFIFLDDRSTDNTLALLNAYEKNDPRIRVMRGRELPPGWTGKNHALQQAAHAATGDWLLFTDADTVHEKFSVSSAMRYAKAHGLDLLTLSAKCVCKSFGEHLIQPMGIACFSVWFRLENVNDPESPTPLACGQYLLIKKDVYFAVGGNAAVRSEVTEDLALFQKVKFSRYPCALGIGTQLFATRMYRSFKEAWVGWRRIYLHALRKNVASLLNKIFMLIANSFGPFLVFGISSILWVSGETAWRGIAIFSGLVAVFILFLRSRSHTALKTSQWSIILHPLSALVIAGIIVDCLRHHFIGRKVEWKLERY